MKNVKGWRMKINNMGSGNVGRSTELSGSRVTAGKRGDKRKT
jgi:hypothetical protein